MASIAERMLGAHPAAGSAARFRVLVECLDACAECATACTMCADACLAEPGVAELTRCIRLDLDCADLCAEACCRCAAACEALLTSLD